MVDPVHSSIDFAVIHNGVSTFRSGFRDYEARLTGGEAPQLEGTVEVASIDIDEEKLKGHLLSPDSSTPSATRGCASSSTELSVDEDGTAAARAASSRSAARSTRSRRAAASRELGADLGRQRPGRALAGDRRRPPRLRPRLEAELPSGGEVARLRGEHRGRARARRGGRVAMRVLGISGSLRRDSLNSALLRAAAERLPAGAELVDVRAAGARSRPTTRTSKWSRRRTRCASCARRSATPTRS